MLAQLGQLGPVGQLLFGQPQRLRALMRVGAAHARGQLARQGLPVEPLALLGQLLLQYSRRRFDLGRAAICQNLIQGRQRACAAMEGLLILAVLLGVLGFFLHALGGGPQLLLVHQRGLAALPTVMTLLELIAHGPQVGILIDHGAQLLVLEHPISGAATGGGLEVGQDSPAVAAREAYEVVPRVVGEGHGAGQTAVVGQCAVDQHTDVVVGE